MDTEIIKKIEAVDWAKYLGPTSYKPENVAPALIGLALVEPGRTSQSVTHSVRSAIGNDHAGTYYFAVKAAIPLIIEISQRSSNLVARRSALAVLDDLAYFKPDIEGADQASIGELECWVQAILKPFKHAQT